MRKDYAERLPFREWLVRQLMLAHWAPQSENMSPAAMAEQLGVTESVFHEAIHRREEETLRRGRAPKKFGKYAIGRTDYSRIRLVLPPSVLADMDEYVRVLRVSKAVLFRSLIHRFLLHPERPTVLSRSWLYRGERHKTNMKLSKSFMVARLTLAAVAALEHHARSWNIPVTHLLRGLMIDFLEGRTKQIQMIGFRELWGDPERYLHPEKFLKSHAG